MACSIQKKPQERVLKQDPDPPPKPALEEETQQQETDLRS